MDLPLLQNASTRGTPERVSIGNVCVYSPPLAPCFLLLLSCTPLNPAKQHYTAQPVYRQPTRLGHIEVKHRLTICLAIAALCRQDRQRCIQHQHLLPPSTPGGRLEVPCLPVVWDCQSHGAGEGSRGSRRSVVVHGRTQRHAII